MTPAVVIIANPSAGYRQPDWRDSVTRILSELGPVEFVTPDSPGGTTVAARDAEQRGVTLIVAAGGDGTAHRVVNGLSSTNSHVGLLPIGTANDLSEQLGLPRTPDQAARAMLTGVHIDIDVVRVNRARVLTVGGFAVLAEAALLSDVMKRRWPWLGPAVYKMAAARIIASRGHDPVAGSFVANQSLLGGSMRLPCESSNDDGVFELVTLAGGSRRKLAQTLLHMTLRTPLPAGFVTPTSLARATLEFEHEVPVFGDGEDLGRGRVFQVVVEPRAVRLRIARAAASDRTLAVQTSRVKLMASSSAAE